MAVYLNKSKFMTKIGLMYYLWKCKGSRATVSYLGIGKEAFRRYKKRIGNGTGNQNVILSSDSRSVDTENKILKYLDGRIKDLDLRIEFLSGTEFQKKIWNTAASIQYGETVSYKGLADISGHSKAWRAAGTALKNNPIILAVPCHRVLKQNGKIGKFIAGKRIKRFLLDMERTYKG